MVHLNLTLSTQVMVAETQNCLVHIGFGLEVPVKRRLQ